jgi:L-threonylcarbamoyladenylate synthase
LLPNLQPKQRAETQSMINEWEKMMYNVFKDIPEVAWQIMDLSENPTTLVLDNQETLLPT